MPRSVQPKKATARGRSMGGERVVVLGAGFAGIRAALGLAREPEFRVVLVDRHRRPAVKTRLHELRRRAPTAPLREILAGTGVRFVCGEIQSIDRADRRVQVGSRSLEYDWLVVALGSRTSDLGVPGVAQHALGFDSARDTERFWRTVERLGSRGGRLAIVGAGPTGVEAAAEAAPRLGRGQVALIEAADRILPGFARLPTLYAEGTLRWMGVHIETRARVTRVDRRRIGFEDGRTLPCEAIVWCAGIEPSPLVAKAGLAPPGRRARVDRYLVSRVDSRVAVIGDCAEAPDSGSGRPSAQIAVQQGDFVAQNLARRVRGQRRVRYRASTLGELLSLGPWETTGKVQIGALELPVFLVGPLATAAKRAGLLRHQAVVAWSSRSLRRRSR